MPPEAGSSLGMSTIMKITPALEYFNAKFMCQTKSDMIQTRELL